MGVTKAFASSGMVLYVGNTNDYTTVTVWTAIGDVTALDGPEAGRNLIDCTHMTSPGNRQEFKPGQKMSGKMNLSGSFAPADPTQAPATGLMYNSDQGTLLAYAIVFNDSLTTTFKCTAYVENVKISAPLTGKVDFSAGLQITGDFLWTTGGVS